MRLGVLSDSHGQVQRTQAAVDLLLVHGAAQIVHCGDIGSGQAGVDVLASLAGAGVKAVFVWGNNDLPGWGRPSDGGVRGLGLEPPESIPLELAADGWRVLVCHGHEGVVERVLRAGEPAEPTLLLSGHTHEAMDQRSGRLWMVNPGALHRAGQFTCCVVDLLTGKASFLPVPR